jgi:hypothetical protein
MWNLKTKKIKFLIFLYYIHTQSQFYITSRKAMHIFLLSKHWMPSCTFFYPPAITLPSCTFHQPLWSIMNLTTITKVITRKNQYLEEFIMNPGYHCFLACPKTTIRIRHAISLKPFIKLTKNTILSK